MRHTRTLTLAAIAVTAAAIAGFAVAQGADPAATDGALGNLALVGLVAGAVAWFRETPFGKRIDGPIGVPAFALLTGAVVATAAEAGGLLGWSPFIDALGRWPGAIAAGVAIGIEAVFGVSVTKYGAQLFAKSAETGKVTISMDGLKDLTTSLLPAGTAGPARTAVAFVIDAAKALLGRDPTGNALTAIYPLIAEYAQDPALLTDDRRAKIQLQVLAALRTAGLVGTDLGQDPAP